MKRTAAHATAVLLPLIVAACDHRALDEHAGLGACGSPDPRLYAPAYAVMTASSLPPDVIAHWIDGCAIIGFSLDAGGEMVNPAIIREEPKGSGAGRQAIAVLQRDLYAPGPGHFQGTTRTSAAAEEAKPGQLFAVAIGFKRNGTRLNVARQITVAR